MNKNFLYLIDALKSLPGVTTKQAKNIAYFLINKDEFFIETFINRIRELKLHVNYCTQCNNLVEDQMLCPICEDTHRDTSQLCIVNSSDDLNKIEATESYRGLYFTLWEEINNKGKHALSEKNIQQLSNLMHKYNFKEIIIATNWTSAGELTAAYLKNLVDQVHPNINIYRLAVGLPINSAIDYADNTTLKHALINKTKY